MYLMYEAECFFEALSEKLDVVLENNEGRDILFVGNICQLTIEIPLKFRTKGEMSRHVLCIQVKFLRKNETDSICLTGAVS